MGVDATSKQTGGKDCRLEGGGLYYHTFIAVDRRVLAIVSWWWYGNIDFCAGLYGALLDTNLNLTWYFFPAQTQVSSTNRVSFSARPPGGTVALNIIGDPSTVHMSLFQNVANILCWCVFPCCLCLLPGLHHNILLSNCGPVPGIEWLSRHQQSHQWSESVNWVLWFLLVFVM